MILPKDPRGVWFYSSLKNASEARATISCGSHPGTIYAPRQSRQRRQRGLTRMAHWTRDNHARRPFLAPCRDHYLAEPVFGSMLSAGLSSSAHKARNPPWLPPATDRYSGMGWRPAAHEIASRATSWQAPAARPGAALSSRRDDADNHFLRPIWTKFETLTHSTGVEPNWT